MRAHRRMIFPVVDLYRILMSALEIIEPSLVRSLVGFSFLKEATMSAINDKYQLLKGSKGILGKPAVFLDLQLGTRSNSLRYLGRRSERESERNY